MAKLERKTRDQRMVAAAVEAKKEYSVWDELVWDYSNDSPDCVEMLDATLITRLMRSLPGLEREVCSWRRSFTGCGTK